MGKVRIADVAREARVSLGTVSNALNHPERVRPETRKLIEETIERLGYLPNQNARLLAGGSNAVVGLVLPSLSHGCSLQIAGGARNEALRHGFDLLIVDTEGNEELERRYIRYFASMQAIGVLVHPVAGVVGQAPCDASASIVHLGAVDVPAKALSVSADYAAQGRLVTEHVIERGAHHIALLGCIDAPKYAQRLAGMRGAASAYPEVTLEILDRGRCEGSSDGARLGKQLAERPKAERPDAVICLSDALAAGAIAGIRAAGCTVPDDIMVAGCDGNPLAWGSPIALTTCSPAGYELGRKGVQLLAEEYEAMQQPESSRSTQRGADHAAVRKQSARTREILKPFLLERASTMGSQRLSGDADDSGRDGAADIREYDMGVYL